MPRKTKPDGQRGERGLGSVYQRTGDGRWVVVVPLAAGPNGKRQRITEYHATQREAERAYRRLLQERDAGRFQNPAEAWSVAAWLERWVEQFKPPVRREDTFLAYRQRIRHQILPHLGSYKLADLTAMQVRDWLLTLRDGGLARSTITGARRILRTALDEAVDLELLVRNPAARVKLPPMAPQSPVEPLTVGELGKFFVLADRDRFAPLWRLALLGLRHAELLAVRWSDVDWDCGELTVSRQLKRRKGRWETDAPVKTTAAGRRLPLNSHVLTLLAEHRDRQRAAGQLLPVPDLIFTSAAGQPLHGTVVRLAFLKLLKAAGIRRSKIHNFRHAQATTLADLGVHDRIRSEILGHSSPAVTNNKYTMHSADLTAHRVALDALERAISEG